MTEMINNTTETEQTLDGVTIIDDVHIENYEEKMKYKLSPSSKHILEELCKDKEPHQVINVTFEELIEAILTRALSLPVDSYKIVIDRIDKLLKGTTNLDKTQIYSGLANTLYGYCSIVDTMIADPAQLTDILISLIHNGMDNDMSRSDIIKMINEKLEEFDMEEDDKKKWFDDIEDFLPIDNMEEDIEIEI